MKRNYCRKGEEHKIENYELAKADRFKGWTIHHRLELTLDGEYAHSRDELKRMDMYFNRPYFELIYMKNSDHSKLHATGSCNPNTGKHRSEETRNKIRISNTGKIFTEEHCRNISKAKSGCKAWNKGIPSKLIGTKLDNDVKKKMSDAAKGRKLIVGRDGKKHWYKEKSLDQSA